MGGSAARLRWLRALHIQGALALLALALLFRLDDELNLHAYENNCCKSVCQPVRNWT